MVAELEFAVGLLVGEYLPAPVASLWILPTLLAPMALGPARFAGAGRDRLSPPTLCFQLFIRPKGPEVPPARASGPGVNPTENLIRPKGSAVQANIDRWSSSSSCLTRKSRLGGTLWARADHALR
jgi:hypothetical protein